MHLRSQDCASKKDVFSWGDEMRNLSQPVVAKLAVGVAARAVDASSTTTKHLSWFDLVW